MLICGRHGVVTVSRHKLDRPVCTMHMTGPMIRVSVRVTGGQLNVF